MKAEVTAFALSLFNDPPAIPSLILPEPPTMPAPVLEVPKGHLPSYKPLVVPPSNLRAPPGVKGGPVKEPKPQIKPPLPKVPEVNYIEVPFVEKEVPLPSNEILVTAVSTATVSVAATLTATAVFKRLVSLFKPLIKTTWKKLTKSRD